MHVLEQARKLLDGLGGIENIVDVEPCSTRVRVVVQSLDVVDPQALRLPEVLGIVMSGHVVQIVAGTVSNDVAIHMRRIIGFIPEVARCAS